MIGSLLYLTASRSDIMFSVCLFAMFQSSPKESYFKSMKRIFRYQSHLKSVKRIFRYLKGSIDYGLWYPKEKSFGLVGYSAVDFAGCSLDRKSTSGTCHFIGHSLTSWPSKKQNSMALSTAEAEYVAAGTCVGHVIWMKQTVADFGVIIDDMNKRCDNTSAIKISKNPI
ncbi:transmembrane signal receptor [Lithospermum erythrorhizon]|uniref:Transmembrane signal receptor n=1 Tax=Lithospermum erythrorhizon TaxID=34254 RepID=A0AAV3P9R5_LITER